jgi:hypothetical protein
MATDINAFDSFFIDQKFTLGVNRYSVHEAVEGGGGGGALLAFCQQKRLAFKEDLRFFDDESRTRELFRIKARKMMDLGGRYDVTDADGNRIGILERRFKKSLIRATWAILDNGEKEIAWAHEQSMVIAIVRRLVNLLEIVPFVGTWLAMFIPVPYHFDIFVGDTTIGSVERVMGLRDRYRLAVPGDPDRTIDRRLVVALGVGLDALQSR